MSLYEAEKFCLLILRLRLLLPPLEPTTAANDVDNVLPECRLLRAATLIVVSAGGNTSAGTGSLVPGLATSKHTITVKNSQEYEASC